MEKYLEEVHVLHWLEGEIFISADQQCFGENGKCPKYFRRIQEWNKDHSSIDPWSLKKTLLGIIRSLSYKWRFIYLT